MSQILVFFDTTANPLSAAQQEVLTLALTLGQVSVVTVLPPRPPRSRPLGAQR